MQQIRLEPVDRVQITTIVDNVTDALLRDEGPARRAGFGPRIAARFTEEGGSIDAFAGEHGFSALIEVERDGRSHRVLFDTGVSERGAVENMRRLELPPKDIEAIVLSHGHFDHTMGLHGLADELGRSGMPVVVHPASWTRRRINQSEQEPLELPTLSRSALEGAGFEIIEDPQPSFLLDGSLLVTGEVARTTDFEQGMPTQEALRGNAWVPDRLTLDDQAAVLHVRGKGLVVLTGCGHAGIVNTVRHARKLTGVHEVYAVVGGFHLSGPAFEPIIPQTMDAFAAFAPRFFVPAHCTGWKATHRIAAKFPDAFVQNSVGTRFEL
jgi:7,8-dihydropterin-6-yl-methyl-4-(beta-D-ribofuranosyl)aminobenzene 5'-phosphate synthase